MKEILSNVRGRKLLNDLWSVSHFPWISHFLTICYMYTDYRQYRWYRQCDLPDPPTYQPESLTIPIREVHSIYAPKIQALPERGGCSAPCQDFFRGFVHNALRALQSDHLPPISDNVPPKVRLYSPELIIYHIYLSFSLSKIVYAL